MFSPSRAEIGESGFARYDVPVPPSSASSLSGGRREAGRGCLGFSRGFPGNVAQGNQGGAHGVMTGEGIQGGVGSVFAGCAGGQAGVPNLAANGQDPNVCGARNLENDPWSAWYGTQNEQANGCGAPNGCSNASGEQLRFQNGLGPGGMTPQVAAYQQILNLLPAIGGPQLLSLRQVLHDAHGQVRNLPENFGGNVSQPCMGVPQFGLDQGSFIPMQNYIPGQQQQQNGSYDVFAKSEKWIGNPPVPEVAKWTNRETEVLGWQKYLGELVAWAMQASLELGNEIEHSSRWPGPLTWGEMTMQQRSRSMRLFAIIKSTFANHARTATLINAFSEGISLASSSVDMNPSVQTSNGFELIRQLTLEYSIRTRNEALTFRTALANKTFALSASETSPSSVVTDTIRRIDYEAARYQKLIGTLPSTVNTVGLQMAEPDLVSILLRSLPDTVKGFVVHHSDGESYTSYRNAAQKWERQQRMFSDLGVSGKKQFYQLENPSSPETYDLTEWDDDMISAMHGACNTCGSRKHSTEQCTADVSKIKCFRCHKHGHISKNCPEKSRGSDGKGAGKRSKGVNKGDNWNKGKGKKGKGKGKSKGKSKGKKGYGKKGKLNEMNGDEGDEWWDEDDWWYDESGEVSQVWESGEASEWWPEDWSGDWGHEGGSGEQEGAQQQQQGVQSLILSPLILDVFPPSASDFQTGLFLEESSVSDSLETRDETECETLSCMSVSVLHMPEGSCNRMFCGCDECAQRHALFSRAWHQQRLHEERMSDLFPRCDMFDCRCGLVGDESFPSESASEGLVSPVSVRVELVRTSVTTFLNVEDTVSHDQQFTQFFPFLQPLLSEMYVNEDDGSWWLLDSGASTTVMSSKHLGLYKAQCEETYDGSLYRAANGTTVDMHGQAEVCAWVALHDWRTDAVKHRRARLRTLVADIRSNIISTTTLCAAGWKFVQDKNSFQVVDAQSGEVATDIAYFAGCPWIKLQPDWGMQSWVGKSSGKCMSHVCGAEDEGFGVHRLTRASEEALQKHRMQGHVPFDPRCTLCARGKSVFHHRRRRANMLETEVQADFAFLTTRGEVVSEDAPGTIKVLVLTELSSGCIGYVVVESDVSKVRAQICRWLEHFGLTSTTTGVILHTDAERVVRRLKESLSVLRADLNSGGADVTFNESGLADALTYIGLTHNHFSKVQGSDMSPLEFTVNRPLSKPATALFGQTVLAELPSSLRQLCPNETRSVEACFVHPGLNTGPVVQGIFRVDGEQVLKRFVARNLRPIFPIAWNHSLGADVLMKFDNASVEDLDARPAVVDEQVRQPQVGVDPAPEEPNIVEYPDGAPPEVIREMKEPDDTMPFHPKRSGGKRPIKSAPSSRVKRLRVFPKTDKCPACQSGMEAPGIRHSAACKRKRLEFERIQAEESSSPHAESAMDVIPASPVPPPALSPEPVTVPAEIRAADLRGRKRESEQSAEDLEAEMHEGNDTMELESVSLDLRWSDNGDYVLSPMELEMHGQKCLATSPEFFDDLISSVKFSPDKKHTFCKMTLGGASVLVWKPDGLVDDSSLMSLDNEQGFEGMKEEIRNLEHCRTGRIINHTELTALKAQNPHLRLIPSRWVSAYKSPTRVRARIVAKDLNCVGKKIGHVVTHAKRRRTTFCLGVGSSETMATQRSRCCACFHAFSHSQK